MYKIYLKGLRGMVEINRLFESEFFAEGYVQRILLQSDEFFDYEIKNAVTKKGIKKKK